MKKFLLIFFTTFLPLFLSAQTCPLEQNLVKGGSFESNNDLNEWSIISGDATPLLQNYDSNWAGTPPDGAGEYFLYARGDSVTLKQSIDLSNCNFTEDYSYDFSVYIGGYGDGDTARVQVILKDENGNAIDGYDTDYQTSDHQMNKFSHKFTYSNNIKQADIIIKIDRKNNSWWDKDADGYVDLVDFKVIKTQYLKNFQDFNIINSLESRIIRGNFAIAGNTVMCLTDKTDGFNGNCQDDSVKYETSNLRVSKYLDIDNDDSTWNSTSSYIELPNSYEEEDNGTGIVWAGLFWQGRVSWDNDHPLRYGVSPFNGGNYIRTDGGSFNIINSDANKILLKINNKDYQNVEANKLAYYTYSNGTTYAAYADVTKLLQEAKLKKGKNSFQIANLLTNEGRENSPGIFGGWSLVVIYKEDLSGRVRSINSYFGFRDIYEDTPIKISGLKLPKSGDVSSKAALFSGEGEYLYGRNENNNRYYDWIKISNQETSNYQYMPDANGNPLPSDNSVGNRDNIFDAHLSGIKRDHIDGEFNDLQTNNDGVDVDLFDLSNIMKEYRDNNPNIDTIYLKMLSNNDYVTPSMIIFATELYTPKVCYDYSLKLGDYASITPQDRNFSVNKVADLPLELKVMIRSEESDFDLIESKLSASFTPNDVFEYNKGDSKYSPPNTYTYEDAIETDSSKGEIAIGDNVSTDGGTLGSDVRNYAKLYYSFKKDRFKGKVDITLDTKISFDGVNKIPYTLSTAAPSDSPFYLDRCPTNQIYDPVYGIINVERDDSKDYPPGANRYSLYTQVVGVDYNISIVGYKKDSNGEYTIETNLNAVPEIELITADTFDNNSSSGYDSICQDPDYKGGDFIDFKSSTRVEKTIPDDFKNYPANRAYRNAIFRAWVLTKKDSSGNRVLAYYPKDTNRTNYDYFKKVYDANYKDSSLDTNYCQESCESNYTPKGCYNCMRVYYGKPFCSRDNFAIRPNSYSIAIEDTNQSSSSNIKLDVAINDGNLTNIAAGYAYKLDINATKFDSRSKVDGYYFNNMSGDTSKKIATAIFDLTNNGYACIDKENRDLSISIFDGKIEEMEDINTTQDSIANALIINNVGKYEIHIEDLEWSKVDQLGYPYKPFPEHADCEMNSTRANVSSSQLKGCLIATNNQMADILPNLPITVHPYTFDLSDIRVENSMVSNSNFVYISDIDNNNIKSNLPNIMALSIKGDIVAKGKNGTILTNYQKNCMAQDTDINITYNVDKKEINTTISNSKVNLLYYNYNEDVDGNNTNYPDANHTLPSNNKQNISIKFQDKYFNNIYGKANYNTFINFQRSYNDPINPFKLSVYKFDIKSPKDKLIADLNSSFIPQASKNLNTTKTFYYAKIKPIQTLYDDIYDDNITTPIGVAIYCSDSLNNCAKYLDIKKGLSDEYDWWWAKDHNGSGYGGAILKLVDSSGNDIATNKIDINPKLVNNFNEGMDNNVTIFVKQNAQLSYPYKVKVEFAPAMQTTYPYFMYNSESNTPPTILETINFIKDNNFWSGGGDTGHVTDFRSNGRRTKKLDW